MLKLTRLFVLIAVASLAVGPVMACCVTGHAETISPAAKVETPPCHGESSSSEHGRMPHEDGSQSPFDCPGCLDCDASVMQAQSVDDAALLSQQPNDIPIAVLASRFDGFEHRSIVFKTGPPGDPPTTHQTPITLKQRLLI